MKCAQYQMFKHAVVTGEMSIKGILHQGGAHPQQWLIRADQPAPWQGRQWSRGDLVPVPEGQVLLG